MAIQPSGGEPRAVYVSDTLQARLDSYRDQSPDRTTTSVVFEAVEQLRAQIPELVRTGRAVPASPKAAQTVHYLGTGPVLVRARPTDDQATMLDDWTRQLGLPVTTWLPPVLNAYLPGRKEPDNMPWLVLESAAERNGD